MEEQQQNSSGELLDAFCDESMDLLQDLPDNLAHFAIDPSDTESINVVFRAVHTIKGNAGFFGLTVVKEFAHALEDTFDEIRQGEVVLSEELARTLVEGIDLLGELICQTRDGDTNGEDGERRAELLQRVESLTGGAAVASAEAWLLQEVLAIADEIAAVGSPQGDDWSSRLRNAALSVESESSDGEDQNQDGVSPQANEAASNVPTARQLADAQFACSGVVITELVRPLIDLFLAADENTYGSEHGEAFLRNIDDVITWATQAERGDLAKTLQEARDDFSLIFHSPIDVDAVLLGVVWDRLAPSLEDLQMRQQSRQPATDDATKQEGSAAKSESTADKSSPDKSADHRYLRVRESRIDEFLDDVSSLFITYERLKDLHTRMARKLSTHELVDELRQINASLSGQTTSLQTNVVELRKVPVRGMFSKFSRVARSLASQLGKQIDVHVVGENIEIDKALIEGLDGPLMHMVRNVCDHGIETPNEREARGALPVGNLHLECSLTKTHVKIVIEDDGRGIDPEKLRARAVERGIFDAQTAAALSDQEAVELVFHPGFSTAEQISEISGRGVGLDVVRTSVREHDGDVTISSTVGEGTRFVLEIPMRRVVVVIDGLLVRQDDTTFVLPFDHIREIIHMQPSDLSTVQGHLVGTVRGKPYGAAGLDQLLELDPGKERGDLRHAVLLKGDTGDMLLMVESVIGQRKVVVNDFSSVIPKNDKFGGVAQLGGGSLALVLNPLDLIEAAGQNSWESPRTLESCQVS